MPKSPAIVYCHCAYAHIVPDEVRGEVLKALAGAGVSFEAVADLCELSARRDPALKRLAEAGAVQVAACYPRAVRWLFAAAGAPLADSRVEILNMRAESAETIIRALLGANSRTVTQSGAERPRAWETGSWIPWFPVIDYDRCENCMQCLNFCLFGVFGVSDDGKVEVQNPEKCKTNCPACARICPEVAIIFPKYKAGPINGEEVREEDLQREKVAIDPSALVRGDLYAILRARGKQSSSDRAGETDEQRALEERKECAALAKLQEELDVGSDVLMSLPVMQGFGPKANEADRAAETEKKRPDGQAPPG